MVLGSMLSPLLANSFFKKRFFFFLKIVSRLTGQRTLGIFPSLPASTLQTKPFLQPRAALCKSKHGTLCIEQLADTSFLRACVDLISVLHF